MPDRERNLEIAEIAAHSSEAIMVGAAPQQDSVIPRLFGLAAFFGVLQRLNWILRFLVDLQVGYIRG